MKTYTQYLTFNTKEKYDFINITSEIEEALKKKRDKRRVMFGKCHAYNRKRFY